MYRELIEKLNPKPTFNLKWYKDGDLYSDGDIEDILIKLIAENEPEKYADVILANMSWPTYYHLTHLRKNILNWYPFEKESSVLEIGCGMGAITNMLCEKCHDVTAVELSKRRATATLLRCRERENLEIIVGNLNDIQFDKKFDYITLIGVLEYQGTYTNTENPYLDFLMEIKKFLKPGGKLLIAIENKYGLKYWCGAREDHTGFPFEGMNQYSITNKGVRTFSKKELEDLVKDSGFAHSFFYYPLPDYKLPTVLYSQKQLPKNENMHNLQPYYIPDRKTLVADEMGVYKDVIENGVFEFFANSFLVECSDDGHLGRVTFSCFSTERKEKYRIATLFTDEGKVEKVPLNETEGAAHIWQGVKNGLALQKAGKNVLPMQLKNGRLVSEFVQGQSLEEVVLEAVERKNKFEVCRILDMVYQEILTSSERIGAEENIFYTMEIDKEVNADKYGPILKVGFIDMILRNAFYVDGQLQWFDQEWVLECVPAGFVFYRMLVALYQSFPYVDKVLPVGEIANKYGLLAAWNEYNMMENLFADMVIDRAHVAESNVYRGGDRTACVNNIQKLLGISP
jgi:SAM-dependent methyltransferase